MRADLEAYLDGALEIIQKEALYAGRVDWAQMTRECQKLCADAQTTMDCYPALRHALAALGDGHSFLGEPGWQEIIPGDFGLTWMGGVVVELHPQGPAAQAGLRLGDRLLAVNGQAIGAGLIAGYPKDVVRTGQSMTVTVQRGDIVLEAADLPRFTFTPQSSLVRPGVGLLVLPKHGGSGQLSEGGTYQSAVQSALLDLASQGATRWIVDLRLNLGGNCYPMLAGLGPLTGEGLLGSFVRGEQRWPWHYEREDRDGVDTAVAFMLEQADQRACEVWVSSRVFPTVSDDVPVAVLLSGMTASSGEVAALSMLGRAGTRTFGQPTRGKTIGNSTHDLPDGAALVISGVLEADRTGQIYDGPIPPDVHIETDWAEFQTAADPVLAAALEWLETA
ncbi:S41 family peptidase [Deinococcus marmoris]|uniref:Carboxyl-terminal protease n=1 Tax=Deinococcus marmoris TaxID=249408 RepID=A0A1U7NYF1_9DEIO|nr:S41 family peptidase [Deinococcus marmoris]OLV17951.1 Carboxyl-terminal protease [Deinococcus marmoris]